MRPLLYAAPLLALFAQAPERTATFTNGAAEALGTCDVRPESIACWDLDGKPAPELASSLRSSLSNGGDVSFRLGKKNRTLAVCRPQAMPLSYHVGENNSVYASSTYNMNPVFDFIRVAVEPSETSAVLSLSATIQSPQDLEIPFREGSKAEIEGRTLEIGPPAKAGKNDPPPNNPYGRPVPGESWIVPVSLSGDPNTGYWNYTPLDAASQPIRYVDAKGQPITALKALALEPTLQPGGGYYNPPNDAGPARPKKPRPRRSRAATATLSAR